MVEHQLGSAGGTVNTSQRRRNETRALSGWKVRVALCFTTVLCVTSQLAGIRPASAVLTSRTNHVSVRSAPNGHPFRRLLPSRVVQASASLVATNKPVTSSDQKPTFANVQSTTALEPDQIQRDKERAAGPNTHDNQPCSTPNQQVVGILPFESVVGNQTYEGYWDVQANGGILTASASQPGYQFYGSMPSKDYCADDIVAAASAEGAPAGMIIRDEAIDTNGQLTCSNAETDCGYRFTVIELEGGGFETLTQAFGGNGRAVQWATDLSGIDAAPGIGSTMPGNIQQVYETYCNYTPSQSSIRSDLALSNPYGIWAAAGYLRLLRDDFAKHGYGYLTNREDAISYNVGGETDWPILTKSNWQGTHATPRGEAYDAVSALVAASPGY
jgi:hypothetical protein